MSDIPSSLVDQLAAAGTKVAYLPASPRPGVSNAVSERYATRPDVRAAAESYFDSPDRLHGDSMPETTLLTEKPVHRMMVYLSASGASADDIATQTGYTAASVRQVLKQPWARQRLVQILNETGRDRVAHFLKNQVAPSLETLQEIRDDTTKAAAARITAANSILDRALGKATIKIESDTTTRNVPGEVARIDSELAAVRKQLASKGVEVVPASN
jgi:hypothetical protein